MAKKIERDVRSVASAKTSDLGVLAISGSSEPEGTAEEAVLTTEPALPETPSSSEEHLVDEAIAMINGLYVEAGLLLAVKVGQYILDKFYGGDPVAYRCHGAKHNSLRRLAVDPRLRLDGGYPQLCRFIGAAILYARLPEAIRDKLRVSDFAELLPVQDEERQLRLASEQAESPLPVRQFRERVMEERRKAGEDIRTPQGAYPTPRSLASAASELAERIEQVRIGSRSGDFESLEATLSMLESRIQTMLGHLRVLQGTGVTTSQHPVPTELVAAPGRVPATLQAPETDEGAGSPSTGNKDVQRGVEIPMASHSLAEAADRYATELGPEAFRDWLALKWNEASASAWKPPVDIPATTRPAAPPLPYLGGKRDLLMESLLPWISKSTRTRGRVVVETHVGGGSVFLNVLHHELGTLARINDRDPAVADFWTAILRHPDSLVDLIRRELSFDEASEFHSWLKDRGRRRSKGPEAVVLRAYRKLVFHVASFRNKAIPGTRLSPSGVANWNKGRERRAKLVLEAHRSISGRVLGNECLCLDALEMLDTINQENELVVLDPPYWTFPFETDATSKHYTFGYSKAQHIALQAKLAELRCPWLLCYGYPVDTRPGWHTDDIAWAAGLLQRLYGDSAKYFTLLVWGRWKLGGTPEDAVRPDQDLPREMLICPTQHRQWFGNIEEASLVDLGIVKLDGD